MPQINLLLIGSQLPATLLEQSPASVRIFRPVFPLVPVWLTSARPSATCEHSAPLPRRALAVVIALVALARYKHLRHLSLRACEAAAAADNAARAVVVAAAPLIRSPPRPPSAARLPPASPLSCAPSLRRRCVSSQPLVPPSSSSLSAGPTVPPDVCSL